MNEVNNIPEGWVETTLGDVMRISSGKARPKTFGNYPVYGGNGILDYADEFNFDNETIIVGRVGAYCGCVYYENGKFWLSDNALGIKSNEKSDIKFLYYYLININLNKKSIGGAQPLLTQGILNQIEIIIPQDIDEQKSIAAILTSFDDKIELLQAQNKTLEELAQTIFKEWFGKYKVGDELPEGWREGKLGDEFDITIGRTPPRIEQEWFSDTPTGKKWISIKDMGNSGVFIFDTSEYLTDEAISKFNIPIIPENTTLLSFKMTVGKLTITTEEMLSNEAIAHLKIKRDSYLTSEYIYLYLQNLDFNSLGSTSSIVTAINSTIIKNLDFIIPQEIILKDFQEIIHPIFNKIKTNTKQIQTLTKTRDELLPKLMTGEIRVKM